MSRPVLGRARGQWPWALVVFAAFTTTLVARASVVPQARTVKDKVYTKEQAARGEAIFTRNCAKCHLLADRKPSDPIGNNDGPSLAGSAFLTKWDGKSVFELTSGMRLSMPPDGSITLSEDDAADVAAYLIKANGFPEGDKPLKADTSARTLMWVKPDQARAGAALTPIAEAAAATLVIPGSADFLVADDDAVWITNRGRLEKLVRTEQAPVASVVVPRPCGAPAIGFGAVWVANCTDQSLYRIDRSTATVTATIATGLADRSGELSVAAGAGSVWVLSDAAGVLSRIDPQTNQVTAKIPVAPNSFAAVFDFGAVWVTNTGARGATGPGAVQRIDPSTNTVVATIPVGPVPRFLAAGEGGVWTLNQGDGTVTRIDPATNKVVATIDTGASGGGGDIATGAGRVWVRATKILLQSIDPATNAIVDRYGPVSGSGAVRVANGHVWVSAHDIQTVWVLKSQGVAGSDVHASDSDAVYLAVLQAMFRGRFELHQPIDGSELLILDHTNNEYTARLLAEHPENVTKKWPQLATAVADFLRGKDDSRAVASANSWPTGCRLVPKSVIDMLFEVGPAGWEGFHVRFPRATGFVTFSNVGYTTPGDEAFVYVVHSCGGRCATGHYVWMKKFAGAWQVADQVMAWIS